jgi:hypothetical protein
MIQSNHLTTMKTRRSTFFAIFLLVAASGFTFPETNVTVEKSLRTLPQAQSLSGAWQMEGNSTGKEGITAVKILSDNYFMVAYYERSGKKFISASGGTYAIRDGKYTETLEYHSQDSTIVGSSVVSSYKMKGKQLTLSGDATRKPETWVRIDGPPSQASPLAGAWRIREREQEGKMVPMQRGPRKTIKILSGTRFQWAAINTETKQFFGTGGGTYTVQDGKYTENIEFFSRDNSRVGASLSFDFSVQGQDWLHSGLSSTGNPIKEVWTKE